MLKWGVEMKQMNKKINNFYSEEVILSHEKISDLRQKKDLNIDRLKEGISVYNEKHGKEYELYESLEQGSIAMSTAIEPEYDDFDIDVGIIFKSDNIPSQTEEVKDLIIEFLSPYNYLFKRNPIKKENCIRIEYQDDYHIDFAIYRVSGDYYEHCGNEWTERNPRSITNWFIERNKEYDNNLRKITRLIKYFAKSRKEWDICGGLIISIIIEEQIDETNKNLDLDELMLDIIKKLISRIDTNKSVLNPINFQEIITDDNHKQKLINLKEKLELFVNDLNSAYNDSNIENICVAWNKFFKTDYFDVDEKASKNKCEDNEMFIENIYSLDNKIPFKFIVTCQRYISKDESFARYTCVNCNNNEEFSLTKNRNEKLCFSIDTNISKPYILLWKVKNNGANAINKNMLRGEITFGNELNAFFDNINSDHRFEGIDFTGNHYVECYMVKNDKCIARGRFNVNIRD